MNWIQAHLVNGDRVSHAEIKTAIDFLIQQGIVERDPTGQLRRSENHHRETGNPYDPHRNLSFMGIYNRAADIYENPQNYKGYRILTSASPVDKAHADQMVEALKEFRMKIDKIATEKQDPDRVICLTTTLFNVIVSAE